MRITIRHSSVAAALVLSACFGAADPMPSPGRPDSGQILVSASDALRQGGPVDTVGVIGLEGAAPAEGYIVLTQPATATVTTVKAAADGTFAAVLAAAAGDRILVAFQETPDGPASDPVELGITLYDVAAAPDTPESGVAASGAASVRAAAPAASPPDQAGKSRITGANLTAGELAAVGNVRTGQVVTSEVAGDGTLDVFIPAIANDSIVVILRQPTNGLTSRMVSLSVPPN